MFAYQVDIDMVEGMMALIQLINGIVTTGPFDVATYKFETSLSGLSGTELFTGQLEWDGVTVEWKGEYTYFNDLNLAYVALWDISGIATP